MRFVANSLDCVWWHVRNHYRCKRSRRTCVSTGVVIEVESLVGTIGILMTSTLSLDPLGRATVVRGRGRNAGWRYSVSWYWVVTIWVLGTSALLSSVRQQWFHWTTGSVHQIKLHIFN